MRIIKNGSGYELIDLDRKLKNRVICNLRQRNLRLMKHCLEDAFQLADDRRGDWCACQAAMEPQQTAEFPG